MATLANLEGRAITQTNAIYIVSADDINKLTSETALTAVGDHGAINVWIDDKGLFRCNAMRYMASVEKQVYTDRQSVKDWIGRWLVEIGR